MRITLPREFEPDFYRKMRPYVTLDDEGLKLEFEQFGKKGGAPGSPFCYRENVLKSFRQIQDPILEIGPGHAPDFVGPNVRYLDIVRQDQLKELYPELPEKNGGAPEITYLVADLAEGKIAEKFDLVYSSHNFEHQANPILHINSIADILNPGGFFVAVVPDRNYTFDYYRPNSTLIDILDASKSQTEHDLRTVLSSRTTTHNNSIHHWFGAHGDSRLTDEWVVDKYKSWRIKPDEFVSQHVTTYESDSFKSIFGLLSKTGLINLRLMRVYNTPFLRNEFIAIFHKPRFS